VIELPARDTGILKCRARRVINHLFQAKILKVYRWGMDGQSKNVAVQSKFPETEVGK